MTEKAPAKINAFLKITAKRDGYHEMVSRFIKIETLYDTISFIPKTDNLAAFSLEGDFGCPLEKNTIYKAYIALKEAGNAKVIDDYFGAHAVVVDKNIPSFAGLGGGSSDAASFLKMANRALNLKLSPDALAAIGSKVGADVPFFIYDYPVANVEGIGEIVTPFTETPLNFDILTPKDISCDTVAVFKNFRAKFYKELDRKSAAELLAMPTQDALAQFSIEEANDLFASAVDLYPKLADYAHKPWFFSGSGSSFFRVKE